MNERMKERRKEERNEMKEGGIKGKKEERERKGKFDSLEMKVKIILMQFGLNRRKYSREEISSDNALWTE